MALNIQPQVVYYDKKSQEQPRQTPKPKGKLACYVLANVYRFFELTSKQYVTATHRVDIEQHHLENLKPGHLTNPDGCIKIINPEIYSEAELLVKRRDPRNGFYKIARLCDAKWTEVQNKARSPELRRGHRPMSVTQQTELIQYTTDPADITQVLRDLRFI